MRLLEIDDDGHYKLTRDFQSRDAIPRYAILSHTWGNDDEEVTRYDLINATGLQKPGYQKVQFCAQQARRDGLRFIWIDSCCIDSTNTTEVSEAINSMFRWYTLAAKCYVYLVDVPRTHGSEQHSWELDFQQSRWFTRGWTLQELLAPNSVEFFTRNGKSLGTKKSLERNICDITSIPASALRGSPLSEFSVAERLAWQEHRDTKRDEDIVYSLLGIFDVYMPVIYGEGKAHASRRLLREHDDIKKDTKVEDFSLTFSLSGVTDVQDFIGRSDELDRIHQELRSDGSRRTVVLHGMGGIGKTQLAIKYMKRHRDHYEAIFWLNATSEESLRQSFVKAAKRILREYPTARALSNSDGQNDDLVDAVKEWLSVRRNTRWLLVLDDYNTPTIPGVHDPTAFDIRDYLPEAHQGAVLITTRSARVNIGLSMRIRKLGLADSLLVLARTSRRSIESTDPHVIELAAELDGLPLALATAGAYLEQTAINIREFTFLYKTLWAKLQLMSPPLSAYDGRMLYDTWQSSFDQIQRLNEASSNLLQLWGFLDHQDLWFEIFHENGALDLEVPWMHKLRKDGLGFHGAMRVLCDHGLAERNDPLPNQPDSTGYSIHPSVHSWVKAVLSSPLSHDMLRLTIDCISMYASKCKRRGAWLTIRRLTKHALAVYQMMLETQVKRGKMRVPRHLAELFDQQGLTSEAETMWRWSVEMWNEHDGVTYLKTKNLLGVALRKQGKFAEARAVFEEVLVKLDLLTKPDGVEKLRTMSHIARLCYHEGKYKDAETWYLQVLQNCGSVPAFEKVDKLKVKGELGSAHRKEGKLALAESVCKQALEGLQEILGPEDVTCLMQMTQLASVYMRRNQLPQAETLHKRAIDGLAKALGDDHVDVLEAKCHLSVVYRLQDRLPEAEQLSQEALQAQVKKLGPEHTEVLMTVLDLKHVYMSQGNLDKAQEYGERAMNGMIKVMGSSHPTTIDAIYELGRVYDKQGRLGEAADMFRRSLEQYRTVFPSGHEYIKDTEAAIADIEARQRGQHQ